MHQALDEGGRGLPAVRATSPVPSHYHVELEAELADLHRKPAALLFTSAYLANDATSRPCKSCCPGCVIFSDAKNHASMIAGFAMAGARSSCWRDTTTSPTRGQSCASRPRPLPKIIAFEFVYSMDGTDWPRSWLICDSGRAVQAHSPILMRCMRSGCTAPSWRRHCGTRQCVLIHRVDVVEGTLAKGFGVMGGYIAARRHLSMPFDPMPPASFSPHRWRRLLRRAPWPASGISSRVFGSSASGTRNGRATLKGKLTKGAAGLPTMDNPSHIVPLLVGDPVLTKRITDALLDRFAIKNMCSRSTVRPFPRHSSGCASRRTPHHTDAGSAHLVELGCRGDLPDE